MDHVHGEQRLAPVEPGGGVAGPGGRAGGGESRPEQGQPRAVRAGPARDPGGRAERGQSRRHPERARLGEGRGQEVGERPGRLVRHAAESQEERGRLCREQEQPPGADQTHDVTAENRGVGGARQPGAEHRETEHRAPQHESLAEEAQRAQEDEGERDHGA
jgi:hypothetical protein